MTHHQLWQHYADLWSTDKTGDSSEFNGCLHEECRYCDPNGPVTGRGALAEYMAGFRQAMPGATFRIASVAAHNDRTLSEWSLHAADGALLQTGRSFARHDDQGRLRDITGFFDPQPVARAQAA